MAILIKRAATERKIRELAIRTGETITAAVDRAIDERLTKLGAHRTSGRVDWTRLEALIAKVKASPEIVGHNEHNLPR